MSSILYLEKYALEVFVSKYIQCLQRPTKEDLSTLQTKSTSAFSISCKPSEVISVKLI